MIFQEGQQVYWLNPDEKDSGIYAIQTIHDNGITILIKSEHLEVEVSIDELVSLEEVRCCKECGSTDIDEAAWVNANTHEVTGGLDGDSDDRWCNNCEAHVDFTTLDKYLAGEETNDEQETVQ